MLLVDWAGRLTNRRLNLDCLAWRRDHDVDSWTHAAARFDEPLRSLRVRDQEAASVRRCNTS